MKRLIEEHKNSPEEYDRIFAERAKHEPDWFDVRRWKALIKYFTGGGIIDLGCLDSRISQMIDATPRAYIGVDIASNAIAAMAKEYDMPDVMFEVGDIYRLKYPTETFDYAVMGEVIEHLEYPGDAIDEAVRILKPGGVLAISTPLNEAIEPGAVDADRHVWSFTKQDLRELLELYGKVNFKILGSRYFPYKYHFPTLIAYLHKR